MYVVKDFANFKDTISQDVLDRWTDEILEKIEPQLAGLDSLEQIVRRSRSVNFGLTMRLLEAYHNWLGQNG